MFGIQEDPATGSATVSLAARLDRRILITQGDGCSIDARLGQEGTAEVDGLVVLAETREYYAPGFRSSAAGTSAQPSGSSGGDQTGAGRQSGQSLPKGEESRSISSTT